MCFASHRTWMSNRLLDFVWILWNVQVYIVYDRISKFSKDQSDLINVIFNIRLMQIENRVLILNYKIVTFNFLLFWDTQRQTLTHSTVHSTVYSIAYSTVYRTVSVIVYSIIQRAAELRTRHGAERFAAL